MSKASELIPLHLLELNKQDIKVQHLSLVEFWSDRSAWLAEVCIQQYYKYLFDQLAEHTIFERALDLI